MKYGLGEILKPDPIGRRVDAEDLLAYRDLWAYFHGFNPDVASQQDMDFIFMEVITGLLEWSYYREDEFGIKMAAYAQFAINKKYGNLQSISRGGDIVRFHGFKDGTCYSSSSVLIKRVRGEAYSCLIKSSAKPDWMC